MFWPFEPISHLGPYSKKKLKGTYYDLARKIFISVLFTVAKKNGTSLTKIKGSIKSFVLYPHLWNSMQPLKMLYLKSI